MFRFSSESLAPYHRQHQAQSNDKAVSITWVDDISDIDNDNDEVNDDDNGDDNDDDGSDDGDDRKLTGME